MSLAVDEPVGPRRRPWLAAALGFFWPGVGYLYAGQALRGVLLLLFVPLVELAIYLLAVAVPVPVVNILFPAALWLALHGLLAYGAAGAASEFAHDRPVPPFSRWYGCVAALALTAVVNLLWVHGYRITLLQAFKIPTGGMEATVLKGDRLLATKWAYGWRDPVLGKLVFRGRRPARGELALFVYPEDRSRIFLKRVIGLPAETVEIRDKTVLINGTPLEEPYAQFFSMDSSMRDVWGPQVVPIGSYFVLGDNRDNSRDSRFWGFVPEDDLLGRATVVYWSWDPEARRVRWERIGRLLQ